MDQLTWNIELFDIQKKGQSRLINEIALFLFLQNHRGEAIFPFRMPSPAYKANPPLLYSPLNTPGNPFQFRAITPPQEPEEMPPAFSAEVHAHLASKLPKVLILVPKSKIPFNNS